MTAMPEIDPRAEVILRLLTETGTSLRTFGREVNESHKNIANWLNGDNRPRDESVWNVMLEAAQRLASTRRLRQLSPMPLAPLRVIGNVAAGEGAYNVDQHEDVSMVPASLAGDDRIGWVVTGDSMMPILEDGDIAVFHEHRAPRSKFVYLVRDKAGALRVKRLVWNNSSGLWELQPLNPAYKPINMNGVELLGYLIGYYRQRGQHEKFEIDPSGLMV